MPVQVWLGLPFQVLQVTKAAYEKMLDHLVLCYPYEGAGVLVGNGYATDFVPLKNTIQGEEARTRFNVSPSELNDIRQEILAIVHSHPDHPAVPSKTDRAQPGICGWSSVIVSVDHEAQVDVRSWKRDDPESDYCEEALSIIE